MHAAIADHTCHATCILLLRKPAGVRHKLHGVMLALRRHCALQLFSRSNSVTLVVVCCESAHTDWYNFLLRVVGIYKGECIRVAFNCCLIASVSLL